MNIKKIGIGPDYSSYEELKENNVVAQGWSGFGDLTFAYVAKDKTCNNDFKTFIDVVESTAKILIVVYNRILASQKF